MNTHRYTPFIRKAVRFALTTHEVDQKQKRKGKDIPYISHPLTVGLILAAAGASEDVIAAGILHDTIEDSIEDRKVTHAMLVKEFNAHVADLVLDVTETDMALPSNEREAAVRAKIGTYSPEALLVKSADTLSNATEIADDYAEVSEAVFARFNGGRNRIIGKYIGLIEALAARWPENPLVPDLLGAKEELLAIETKRAR